MAYSCRGLCESRDFFGLERRGYTGAPGGRSPYAEGWAACIECTIMMRGGAVQNAKFCPCCHGPLRRCPRNATKRRNVKRVA